ncbi:hypothetical protein AB0O86_35975 [Streptomyces hirsutus]|uniref:hypothetical protein n=1 Tax=Streptomyces hirsutus TaxID=35620 RepID=UPI003414C244
MHRPSRLGPASGPDRRNGEQRINGLREPAGVAVGSTDRVPWQLSPAGAGA